MWSGRRLKWPYFIGVGIPRCVKPVLNSTSAGRTKVSIQSGVVASFASVCPGTQPAWNICVRISKDGGFMSRLEMSGG